MNKKQLSIEVSNKTSVNVVLVEKIIDTTLETILNVLNSEKINLKNFGIFEVVETKSKVVKSINDQKMIQLNNIKRIKFKASNNAKNFINKL